MTKVYWHHMLRHELEALATEDPVALLAVGSVEQHGPHCPMAVDIAIPTRIAEEALKEGRFPGVLLPPLPFGFAHYNMGFIGTISLRLSTFLDVVSDTCRSLHDNGFSRIIVLNGHGGNAAPIRAVADLLSAEDIFLLPISYWELAPDEIHQGETDQSIGHAGEWETSLMWHLFPDIIDSSRRVTNPVRDPFPPPLDHMVRFAERRREAADGVMGDPFFASPEKGAQLFATLVDRLVAVCTAYRSMPVRHYREFGSYCP